MAMVFSMGGDGSTWVLLCLLPTPENSSYSCAQQKGLQHLLRPDWEPAARVQAGAKATHSKENVLQANVK